MKMYPLQLPAHRGLPSLCLLPFLFLIASSAFAQQATEDVLYLKNGWLLRGKITSLAADSVISIQTQDRNRFVFRRSEVDSVRQELFQLSKTFTSAYKRRGFGHYTELGALAARNTSSSINTSAFSFQTVNGYRVGQALFVGVGVGIDLYATQSLLPLFGSIRGDFTDRGNLIPYYFVDAGYGINITGKDTNPTPRLRYEGGELWAVGVGMKVIFNNNAGFLLSVGYRSQRTRVEQDFGGGNLTNEEVHFNRVAVRAGFAF